MYQIITGRNYKDVEKQVNNAMEKGFQPLGGIAVIPGPMNGTFLYQAGVFPRTVPVEVATVPAVPIEVVTVGGKDASVEKVKSKK
jgi:hypothetical protein